MRLQAIFDRDKMEGLIIEIANITTAILNSQWEMLSPPITEMNQSVNNNNVTEVSAVSFGGETAERSE